MQKQINRIVQRIPFGSAAATEVKIGKNEPRQTSVSSFMRNLDNEVSEGNPSGRR
jgi:hypothetical protein